AYGLVYHYYRSKETLLESIFKETWGAMLATIRSVGQLDEPAREQVRKVTEIVLRSWKRDPELVRVLVREVTRSSQVQQETEEIELAFEALQRIVEQGQQTGEFRNDVDARLTATIWYGALEEILTGWAFGQLPDREEDVSRAEHAVVEIVAGGLAQDRAAAPALCRPRRFRTSWPCCRRFSGGCSGRSASALSGSPSRSRPSRWR